MSAISKNFGISSSLEREVMVIKEQGIVSILGYTNCEKTKSASLRRTLSADMSSQKWLSQHSLKRIASSQQFPVSYEEEEEKLAGQFDIWSSIVSNKYECKNDNDVPPPPYIHPLVKRSSSSLSEKSLQICTESLGSETGSDGFSSFPPSEIGDEKQEEEEVQEAEKEAVKFEVTKDSAFPMEKYSKKTAPKSFPPPLPSLSRGDGASLLHMRPHRDNGRLVLEAVSVPSPNNFRAERQDGRLVLTFIDNEEAEMKTSTDENNDSEDVNDSESDVVAEEVAKSGGGVMNVHRLALLMKKSVILTNLNPAWSNKFNNEEEEIEEQVLNPITLARSLPPRPLVGRMITMTPAAKGGAGSLNAYEYYWKAKAMAPTLTTPPAHNPILANEKQELVVLRGNKGDNYWLPLSSKGCKEPMRRSLLFWEPYCIATS